MRSWRVSVALQMAFSVFVLGVFVCSPDIPQGRSNDNLFRSWYRRIYALRRHSEPQTETAIGIRETQAAMLRDTQESSQYRECFSSRDRIRWRTMIGILVQIGQQGILRSIMFCGQLSFAWY